MTKTIYFDMDGTIADLYGVEGWEPNLRRENPTPYREARPMMDVVMFNWHCQLLQQMGIGLGVISWLSMNSSKSYEEDVTIEKMRWLARYTPILLNGETHFIPYGTPKHEVATDSQGTLVDDSEVVGQEWQKQGGVWVNAKAIQPNDFLSTLLLMAG